MNAVCGESRTYGVDQAKSVRIARDSEDTKEDFTYEGEKEIEVEFGATFNMPEVKAGEEVVEPVITKGEEVVEKVNVNEAGVYILTYTKEGYNDLVITVTVKEEIDEKVAKVSTAQELQEALNNNQIETIILEADITANLDIKRSIVIDGANKTLEGKIIIHSNNVILKNLTVDLNMDKPKEWQSGSYAVQVYKATNAVLENVTLTKANAGLLVNGGKVEVKDVKSVANGFGGIEVSQGKNVDTIPKLTVNGLTHDNAETPAIWIDGKTTNDGWVEGEGFEEIVPEGKVQLWFKAK